MSISHRKPYTLRYYVDGKEVSYNKYRKQEISNQAYLRSNNIECLRKIKRLFIRREKQ